MVGRDGISEEEINRYLDDELPAHRRGEVEAAIAADPALAARVMTDLSLVSAVRSDQPEWFAPPFASHALARRLERRLRRRRLAVYLTRGALAASLLAGGWLADRAVSWIPRSDIDTEQLATDAVEAREFAALELSDGSVAETSERKIDRLEDAIRVDVPDLPPSWDVQDVSVQAMGDRPAVVVTADAGAIGALTLVAVPAPGAEPLPPVVSDDAGMPTVTWQSDDTAYALVGGTDAVRLKTIAAGMEADLFTRSPAPDGRS